MCICNMKNEKENDFYFWDEMWNLPEEKIKKNKNEKITTKNSLENEQVDDKDKSI